MYRTNSLLSQPLTIASLLKPNPVEIKVTQNARNKNMKMENTWLNTVAS